jgi:uncharacterized protein (DUF2249 family)
MIAITLSKYKIGYNKSIARYKEEFNMSDFKIQVDATKYPPREKHPAIFGAFDALVSGEKMELINDHDPRPLYYQFIMERENQFEWEYLEEGPETWRVSISKK